MSNFQSALKFRLAVILALSAFMALSSFWLTVVIKRTPSDAASLGPRSEPDYFVFDFNYVKMLPQGKPHYHLTGKKLSHYPLDDSFLIDMPVYTSLDPQNPPQTARADQAILKEDNTKVHMHGNVVGNRKATKTTDSLSLKTEYLLVYPDEDTMETDKPVTILRGNATIEGVGMYANNATGEFRLHHQATVTLAPQGKTIAPLP
ncbi:MAG: LPS export ABC transporter periplasmic protein LptC [Oxalobacter sp.]|nr:MAG: LPS export ABC transporter periplasmic protein LptC [Oxalobacter sp.]